jgi:uncharacterized membrane protein YkgB
MERAGIQMREMIAGPIGVIVIAVIGAVTAVGIAAVIGTGAGAMIVAIVTAITTASYLKSVPDASRRRVAV